jgi:hypothetical protein
METDRPANGERRSAWIATAPWLVLSVVTAIGWGWLALRVQVRFAPVVLFPLLVGVGVGWSARLLTGLVRGPATAFGWCGTTCASLTAVAAMHVLAWQAHRREFQDRLHADPHVQMAVAAGSTALDPPGFLSYLRGQATRGREWLGGTQHGWRAWLTWAVDAALVVAGGLAAWWFTGIPPPASGRGVRRLTDPPAPGR